ncbi:MAG: biotin--[acetyl-CoA-carboxylase] ligase [Candidatus Melainabacteria bacterium]|mgnify:CR=1 FL=1|jgi:BirA family transcriptional regulator, biotin operon repressor / biotin---[acetyl-CoA-carboxylase] ligase|nr:biotin--[acetyl-CoA-carboxylase] ligase [Candidatus Melainabacteria bacterium]
MRCLYYQLIDSTQNQAKKLIDLREINEVVAIVAEEQSAGRGQYGKSWVSPKEAGLYVSIVVASSTFASLMRDPIETSLTTVVAEAMIVSLNEFHRADYYIKPVNDIYYDGCKLAGILVELYKGFAIIGIGLNLRMLNQETLVETPNAPPISLAEICSPDLLNGFENEAFVDSVISHILRLS